MKGSAGKARGYSRSYAVAELRFCLVALAPWKNEFPEDGEPALSRSLSFLLLRSIKRLANRCLRPAG